jgi:predicted transcriptional regulator of viral defense system
MRKLEKTTEGRPLSATASKIILTAEEENRQVLTVADFMEFYGISSSYARKMISELVRTGWLIRIAKGQYQVLPAKTGLDPFPMGDKFVLGCQVFPNGFIAYGSAAEHHGLSLQVFNSVIIANTDRSGVRDIGSVSVQLIKIDQRNYVGYESLSRGPSVKVATLERTIIDCIDRPELAGGISDLVEILQRGKSRTNVDRILEYLPSYSSKSLVKKVGFLLEQFDYPMTESQIKSFLDLSAGVKAYLFSPRLQGTSSKHEYSRKWRLIVNASGFFRKRMNEETTS